MQVLRLGEMVRRGLTDPLSEDCPGNDEIIFPKKHNSLNLLGLSVRIEMFFLVDLPIRS